MNEGYRGKIKNKRPGFRKAAALLWLIAAGLCIIAVLVAVFTGTASRLWPDSSRQGFEAARPGLEKQLEIEKERQIINRHLEELKNKSEVKVNHEVVEQGEGGEVVATINGEDIEREKYERIKRHVEKELILQGVKPESREMSKRLKRERKSILEMMVMNVALRQRVEEVDPGVCEEEVEKRYEMHLKKYGSKEAMKSSLEQKGRSKDDLRRSIYQDLAVEAYMDYYVEKYIE